jgi:hypothetical protein
MLCDNEVDAIAFCPLSMVMPEAYRQHFAFVVYKQEARNSHGNLSRNVGVFICALDMEL